MESVTTHDGFEVTSSFEAAEDMRTALAAPDAPLVKEPVSPTAKSTTADADGQSGKTERTAGADLAESAAAKPAAKPRNDPHARMLDATQKEAAAKRERDEAKAEADSLRAQLATLTQQRQAPRDDPKPATPQTPEELPPYAEMLKTKPDLTPEQYLRESYQFLRNQERQEESRRTAEASHMTRVKSLNDKIAAAEKTEPGFWESVKPFAINLVPARELNGKPVTGATAIADVILDSDAPDKLLRHFRDNIADLQRISTLHPVNAFREMGKLEARLEAASSTGPALKAPLVSQANAPLKPVSASPTISDESVPEGELPVDEFFRRGNERQRKRELAR